MKRRLAVLRSRLKAAVGAGRGRAGDPAFVWVALGDSLTEKNYRADVSYHDCVRRDLGCEVINCGVSGTGYREPGDDRCFCDRVAGMDLDRADCLTIFGSFNDLGKGHRLGGADDATTDTIGGCMNLTVERILRARPGLRIGIATPTPWRTDHCYTPDGAWTYLATTRGECDAYVDLLKRVAQRHGLPVLDLYHTFGLDPDDPGVRARYYVENGIVDTGVHPNSAGHAHMYPQWRAFVSALMADGPRRA